VKDQSHDLRFRDVLVVEDETQLARALDVALKHLGLPTRFASTLDAAREEIAKRVPDLILLDRMLPDGDGVTLCQEIRERLSGVLPLVMILSARGETPERVLGLDAGADDYLPKPFSIDELHARIRALSRRYPSSVPETKSVERLWELKGDTLQVLGPKGWVGVTQLEFKLLEKFLAHPGRVVSRDDLLKDVWGFQWLPKTRTVDFFISRIRKNFEIDPDHPRHFMTVRGVGYRFDP
jgi:two-component system alkaline phosphatase synthesis response regulator PhoP